MMTHYPWEREQWRIVYKRPWDYHQLDDLAVTWEQAKVLRTSGRVFSLRYDYDRFNARIAERIELTHEEVAMITSTMDPYWVLGLDDGGNPVRLVILPDWGEKTA